MSSGRCLKFTDIDNQSIRRSDRYRRREGDGWSRIDLTTAGSPIGLLRDIAQSWSPPFGVLYVLVAQRTEAEEGRYQSPRIDTFDDLDAFLIEYWDFFECDGRHGLWISEVSNGRQLVYDNHEIVSAYGDDDGVISALKDRGFEEGAIDIPVPHTHNYHAIHDQLLDALMAAWDWQWFPLQPVDER